MRLFCGCRVTSRSRDSVSARCLGRRRVQFARGDLRAARDKGRGVVRRSSVTRHRRGSAGKELASGLASGALGRVGPRKPRGRSLEPGLGLALAGRWRGPVPSSAGGAPAPVWKAFPQGRCSQPVEPGRCPRPAFPTQLLQ